MYLCTTKDNLFMWFRLLPDTNLIEVKIADSNDKLLSKEIVDSSIFNEVYQPKIKDQLNHLYRTEFWENL